MRGAVADGLHALEVVVGGLEAPVVPSPGAEAHEVDEGAERGELKESPGGHVAGVLRVEVRAVGAAAAHLELAQAVLPVCSGKRCHIVGHDGVAVLSAVLHLAKQCHLLEMLDVERHAEQGVAQLLVERREQAQLAEVEVYVAAVARASLVFREEFAVGCELEEVALVTQVVRGLFLGTQLEGYALLLEVLYLLLDREDRLPIVGFGHARSPVIKSIAYFTSMFSTFDGGLIVDSWASRLIRLPFPVSSAVA